MTNTAPSGPLARARRFCAEFGLRVPVLQAPMAGACPPELAIAVAEAGGMGGCGAVLDGPERIGRWAERFRAGSAGAFQLNIWIPDDTADDPAAVAAATEALGRFGSPGEAGGAAPEFSAQCAAMLAARPTVISSIMGVFDPGYVRQLAAHGIRWFACAVTLQEALAAQDAGADAIVAQGFEAGGHRGSFDPADAERSAVGLFATLPRFADRLRVPIIAAGGIADGRGVAAALALGASAVQVGTALLRCPETGIDKDWSAGLAELPPEHTVPTRAYSGRLGRAADTPFVAAWRDGPRPAPYPRQRELVAQWRRGSTTGLDPVNHWAGQNAALATEDPAGEVVTRMWRDAQDLLGAGGA